MFLSSGEFSSVDEEIGACVLRAWPVREKSETMLEKSHNTGPAECGDYELLYSKAQNLRDIIKIEDPRMIARWAIGGFVRLTDSAGNARYMECVGRSEDSNKDLFIEAHPGSILRAMLGSSSEAAEAATREGTPWPEVRTWLILDYCPAIKRSVGEAVGL